LNSVERSGVYQFVLYDQFAHALRRTTTTAAAAAAATADATPLSSSTHLTKKSTAGPLFACCVGRPGQDLSMTGPTTDRKDGLVPTSAWPVTHLDQEDIVRVLSKSSVKIAGDLHPLLHPSCLSLSTHFHFTAHLPRKQNQNI
jgi:hypothetical protein